MDATLLSASNSVIAEASLNKFEDTKSVLHNEPQYQLASKKKKSEPSQPHYKWDIVWRNVLVFLYLHLGSLYGLYLVFTTAKWQTTVFGYTLATVGGMGITAGAHRLWAHKSYKANLPLRAILCLLQALAFQNHIFEWARDHRVHHKFSETDADPHNAKRGFFFSHIGWLMLKKHKDVLIKGKTVDVSDLLDDPVVMFQKKYYAILMPLVCFVIPTWIPIWLWNESAWVSWYVAAVFRYTLSLNFTWLVNSAAHIWGNKPYDKNIGPTNNLSVALAAVGEGWHNYHHVFPWDYKAAELGNYRANLTTAFIDFFSMLGWAYDLKTVPMEVVTKRALRTGDGSHGSQHSHDGQVWGWGDADMTQQDKDDMIIVNNLEK